MLPDGIKRELIDKLVSRLDPCFVILYGSAAKGEIREDSDIDLAYYGDMRLSPYERFVMAGELARIAGRDVDLVDIREADTVFALQIFACGVPLHIRDENEYIRQKIKAFRMYADLSEKRVPVLETIKKRGSVFGDE
jgi:predicted nucleotidyltransferase